VITLLNLKVAKGAQLTVGIIWSKAAPERKTKSSDIQSEIWALEPYGTASIRLVNNPDLIETTCQ